MSVFIQPDSEQECCWDLIPYISALGISVARSNGEHVMGLPKGDHPMCKTAGVNIVQTTTLPGLNSCVARAKVELPGFEDNYLQFEPDHKTLGTTGVCALVVAVKVSRVSCLTGEPILLVDELKDDHSVVQKENENGVVNNEGDVKLCEPLAEVQQMQMADVDLLPYTEYQYLTSWYLTSVYLRSPFSCVYR